MLAIRRTANVKGRIIFLIVSMITIKDIKARGVPEGVKWAKKELGLFLRANTTLSLHIKMERFRFKDIWDVVERMKGNREKKFNKNTKQNSKIITFFKVRVFIFFFHLFIWAREAENWFSSWSIITFFETFRLLLSSKILEKLNPITNATTITIKIKGFSAVNEVSKIENKFVNIYYHCHFFEEILQCLLLVADIVLKDTFFSIGRCKKEGMIKARINQFMGNIIGKKLWIFNF